MYSEISSAVLDGLYGKMIKVETYIGSGIPAIKIIGLANTTVTEAKERIRAASKITNIKLPNRKIIINLSPANIKKEGSHLDLAILCGIYLANRADAVKLVDNVAFLGEIGLNGEIKTSNGILSMVIALKNHGINKIVIPSDNNMKLDISKEIELIPVCHVKEVIKLIDSGFDKKDIDELIDNHKNSQSHTYKNNQSHTYKEDLENNDDDYFDVLGQSEVKRIMQIAAAGGHNVIILGEPGIGKTMCASRIASILPKLSEEEVMECMLIKSSTGTIENYDLSRPIRSPYKTVTESAMFGGGQRGRVGEVTLAHRGVLILDEMLEFNKKILEGFRQPLEEKRIRISRIAGNYDYPCDFILIGTANPCPCGHYGGSKRCSCTDLELKKYIKKLSGPVLDRIDITYLMTRQVEDKDRKTSLELRTSVSVAREKQFKRFANKEILNSNVKSKSIEEDFMISEEALDILNKYTKQFAISNRGYGKILRVSRTIADLDDNEYVSISNISEALNYRFFDEMLDNS